MFKIAVIEKSYVRDTQIYGGVDYEDCTDCKEWYDLKETVQYLGIIEGENEDEIRKKSNFYRY